VQYPHDGGVSSIRFYLGDVNELADVAAESIDVGPCDAGELVCQCGAGARRPGCGTSAGDCRRRGMCKLQSRWLRAIQARFRQE
jgi:hypothetical protein